MRISSEFPRKWISITRMSLYIDGRPVEENKTEEALNDYETLYTPRVADYIRTLKLKVGQRENSSNSLMPPFRSDKYDRKNDKSWYYFADFNLSVENPEEHAIGKLTVNIERPKRRRTLFLHRSEITTLAEVFYEKSP